MCEGLSLSLSLLTVIGTASVKGQSMAGLGAIGGTVVDSSGAVVAGATVTISNRQIGLQRQVISTAAGTFLIPSLPPTSGYEVLVEQPGFATYLAQDILLHVGESVSLTVRLELSEVSESVTVTAAVFSGGADQDGRLSGRGQ